MAARPLGIPQSEIERSGEDQIARELYRLGIRHLSWDRDTAPGSFTKKSLLVDLAASLDARLRNALVPLFLFRPDYADAVVPAADELTGPSRAHLVCTYSAAVAFQKVHRPRLVGLSDSTLGLPDYFSDELDLSATQSPDSRLAAIGDRHARLSGEDIDWCGTYHHAVEACLRFAVAMPG
jgi:hypothetical protein